MSYNDLRMRSKNTKESLQTSDNSPINSYFAEGFRNQPFVSIPLLMGSRGGKSINFSTEMESIIQLINQKSANATYELGPESFIIGHFTVRSRQKFAPPASM